MTSMEATNGSNTPVMKTTSSMGDTQLSLSAAEVATLMSFSGSLAIDTAEVFDGRDTMQLNCPGLSLKHEAGSGSDPDEKGKLQDRQHAIEHAVSLLSRPLSENDAHSLEYRIGPNSAAQLKENIYAAFAVLVDSRLHAYTSFLARHALSRVEARNQNVMSMTDKGDKIENLQRHGSEQKQVTTSAASIGRSIEEKIASILSVGSGVEANSVITRFEIEESGDSSLLCFAVGMDLSIPFLSSSKSQAKATSVAFSSNGSFSNASSTSPIAKFNLDVHKLLENMITQASRVVSSIVAVASENQQQHQQMQRSASCLMMPPPPTMKVDRKRKAAFLNPRGCKHIGLELLSATAAELPIVSPDLSGRKNFGFVPSLDLDNSDVSDLSIDQCADVVDACLDFLPSPKKPKLEG